MPLLDSVSFNENFNSFLFSNYLFECFNGLPVAVRILSTSSLASLFAHLNTTTDDASLLFVLLAWLVNDVNCRSSKRYINISLSLSGTSACTQVGSTFSNGIDSAIVYKSQKVPLQSFLFACSATCVARSNTTSERSVTNNEHGLLIKLCVCSFWRNLLTTSAE